MSGSRSNAVATKTGLAESEACRRLELDGPNELPRPPRRGPGRIALGVLGEPMFLLLVVAAGIYLVIGDPQEGALLAFFAALTVGLVVVQQARSEHALDALRELAAPSARVLRDGIERRLPARAVVRGDLLLVGEGERIAADATLVRCEGLAVDESLLTGESVAVDKLGTDQAGPVLDASADRSDTRVYAGTLVVRGHGIAEVQATGVATQAGKIGVSLATIELESTLLQRAVARLVRWFGLGALVVASTVVVLYARVRGDWVEGTLAGIAIAMALLPEEFPMVLAVFLAIGAWRLSRISVLVRRPAVIETLGAASVLCVDKTGTLTENRMRLQALLVGAERVDLTGSEHELPEAFHRVLEFGVLASKRRAFDPMDEALHGVAQRTLVDTEHLHLEWPLEREYGLTPQLPAFTRAWLQANGTRVVAVKGAPEAVAGLCRLDEAQRGSLHARVEQLAAEGMRVLAVASGGAGHGALPDEPQQLEWRLEGLLGFRDPLREGVDHAVREARAAGITVAMITGDHPATARAIAVQAGIDLAGGVLDGATIDALNAAGLATAVRRTRVFARIRPEQKLRLVEAYKDDGEVVAMTGDGVNDAPALKAAHIGLAMGGRGTDVAREAAGIVLLDDAFGSIVAGIRMGRRIFDNLRKVLIYIAAIHVPIAGLALLPVLLGLPPLLLPMHVVLIEMVIDPICSIAFESEPEERDIMHRAPRHPDQALMALPQLALAMVQGALLFTATFAVYAFALRAEMAADAARTLTFVALTAGNLALVRVAAVRDATLPRLFDAGHRAYWVVAAVATVAVAGAIGVPGLAALFHFAPCPPASIALAAAAGVGAAFAFDLLKPLPAVRRALGASARA